MARKGDACFEDVVWAMTVGIKKHPDLYNGLTEDSLFEDFQRHLYRFSGEGERTCPPPCTALRGCQTSAVGSTCWENVQWAMGTGMSQHPEWYEGLSAESPAEDFQNLIHEVNATLCPEAACNPQPFKRVTFFCWSVCRSEGYELGLLRAQLQQQAGIFACDDYALVSDTDLRIDGLQTLLIASTQVSGFTDAGTSPNAQVFVDAWHAVRGDGRYQARDWVIKADPDTVLIASRLRVMLSPGNQPSNPYPPPFEAAPGAGQWVTNCDKMAAWGKGWGDGWPMMYGSLEIISRDAINNYFANEELCKGSVDLTSIGEDAFMGLCLRKLQAGELFLKQDDGVCAGGGVCTDSSFQAYHPRKDISSWMQCWHEATR